MTILITGPESSGKTSLSVRLAAVLDGLYVAEAARAYLQARNGHYAYTDLTNIWREQEKAEDTARASSASFVVCDTGPEVIQVWADVKYGKVPTNVQDAVVHRKYDLTLLCAPDLPWEPDPLREAEDPAVRQALFRRYRKLLPDAVVITGLNRVGQALWEINNIIDN